MRKAITKGFIKLAKKIKPNITNAMDARIKNVEADLDSGAKACLSI